MFGDLPKEKIIQQMDIDRDRDLTKNKQTFVLVSLTRIKKLGLTDANITFIAEMFCWPSQHKRVSAI